MGNYIPPDNRLPIDGTITNPLFDEQTMAVTSPELCALLQATQDALRTVHLTIEVANETLDMMEHELVGTVHTSQQAIDELFYTDTLSIHAAWGVYLGVLDPTLKLIEDEAINHAAPQSRKLLALGLSALRASYADLEPVMTEQIKQQLGELAHLLESKPWGSLSQAVVIH